MTNVSPWELKLPVFLLLSFWCHKTRLINTFKSQLKNIFTDQLPLTLSSDSFVAAVTTRLMVLMCRWEGASLYLVLTSLGDSLMTFPGTRSPARKCHLAKIRQKAVIFRLRPQAGGPIEAGTNWKKYHVAQESQSISYQSVFFTHVLSTSPTWKEKKNALLFLVVTKSDYPAETPISFIQRSWTRSLQWE